MMTTLNFHVRSLLAGFVFILAFLSPVILGAAFVGILFVQFGA